MKRYLLLLGILSAFAFNDLLAAPPSYIQTKDGVIVFTAPLFTGTSNAVKLETITINIYGGADVSFNLYEDEGTNYNYEKGAFPIIPIVYNEATKNLLSGTEKAGLMACFKKGRFELI
jgi:alpha-D-xyloside xylohydrolase